MRVTLTDQVTPSMREAIVGPLVRFNEIRAEQSENYRPLAVLISDPATGDIVGGLWGETMFSYLHVDLLFVPEEIRKAGLGRQVLTLAEEEAKRRGCHGVWLQLVAGF